jgi:hypothetical protein
MPPPGCLSGRHHLAHCPVMPALGHELPASGHVHRGRPAGLVPGIGGPAQRAWQGMMRRPDLERSSAGTVAWTLAPDLAGSRAGALPSGQPAVPAAGP